MCLVSVSVCIDVYTSLWVVSMCLVSLCLCVCRCLDVSVGGLNVPRLCVSVCRCLDVSVGGLAGTRFTDGGLVPLITRCQHLHSLSISRLSQVDNTQSHIYHFTYYVYYTEVVESGLV